MITRIILFVAATIVMCMAVTVWMSVGFGVAVDPHGDGLVVGCMMGSFLSLLALIFAALAGAARPSGEL